MKTIEKNGNFVSENETVSSAHLCLSLRQVEPTYAALSSLRDKQGAGLPAQQTAVEPCVLCLQWQSSGGLVAR